MWNPVRKAYGSLPLPELKLFWVEKRQLMFVLTAAWSERCVGACRGATHMVTMWHNHNQMKENCLISPAAWFKFHLNQIGGRDKCQLVPLPCTDLGGKVLHLITCMLWFSYTPKILGHQIGKICWWLNHLIVSPVHISFSSSSLFKNVFFSFEANTAVAALGDETSCPCRRAEWCSIRKFTIRGQDRSPDWSRRDLTWIQTGSESDWTN